MTALTMNSICKSFPGTLAIDKVDFDVRPGEVHALLGENGAGKSTLMKILAGSYSDYSGEIYLKGEKVRLDSPAKAIDKGIGMIYQELSLSPSISVAENLMVGRLPLKGKLRIDRRALIKESRRHLKAVGLHINPNIPVSELSQHEAQLVEIAKAVSYKPNILVMDEPTSSLSRENIKILFSIVEKLKNQGIAIIYITHRLSEIFRIADRITILRDGRKVLTADTYEMTSSTIANIMVGRELTEFEKDRDGGRGREKLRVTNLSRAGFFYDMNLSLQAGEIVGLGGLSGAGRTKFGRSLCGLDPSDRGEVAINGSPLKKKRYRYAIKAGMVYLSEDRIKDGLYFGLNVKENVLSAVIDQSCRAGIYREEHKIGKLRDLLGRLKVQPDRPEAQIAALSGGNQQKVFLAKWLAAEPDIMILDEPTKGVDVGARNLIHEAIQHLADRGKTILLISSDLSELVALSDRVLIMRRGTITSELDRDELSEDTVFLASTGEGAY